MPQLISNYICSFHWYIFDVFVPWKSKYVIHAVFDIVPWRCTNESFQDKTQNKPVFNVDKWCPLLIFPFSNLIFAVVVLSLEKYMLCKIEYVCMVLS